MRSYTYQPPNCPPHIYKHTYTLRHLRITWLWERFIAIWRLKMMQHKRQFAVMKTAGNLYTFSEVCPWSLVPHTLHFMSRGTAQKRHLGGRCHEKCVKTQRGDNFIILSFSCVNFFFYIEWYVLYLICGIPLKHVCSHSNMSRCFAFLYHLEISLKNQCTYTIQFILAS